MTKTIRLALIGASILALTSPVLARTATKGDRMSCTQTAGTGALCNTPVSLQERPRTYRAPDRMIYDWNAGAGHDRASSPYAGGDHN